jgi:hypothetical protein
MSTLIFRKTLVDSFVVPEMICVKQILGSKGYSSEF